MKWRYSTMAILALLLDASRVFAQCDPAVHGAVPTDSSPDDWGIQQCLNQGGQTNLAAGAQGYLITNTLAITVPGTILVGPISPRAHLVATTALDSSVRKRILESINVDNVRLENLWFDGRKDTRDPGPCFGGQIFEYGKNILVTGNGFRILNVMSSHALCGSAAEVQGSGFEIANSIFKENGYGEDVGGPWADGLTVWSCSGGASIHDNDFPNNTDIGLVVGGGGVCHVRDNTITNTFARAFAGLHIGSFAGGNGDHRGITYSGNTITSAVNLMAFGLLVGFHPWDSAVNLAGVGSVSGNSVSGAVINLQIEADMTGTATGTVTANPVSNPQGFWGFGSCGVQANYAVYPTHAGRMSYDPGYLSLKYDDETCTIQ